jgi:hypothetical protein
MIGYNPYAKKTGPGFFTGACLLRFLLLPPGLSSQIFIPVTGVSFLISEELRNLR